MTPIYNDPNHKYYGPCRRIHLILLYLYGSDLPVVERNWEREFNGGWTALVVDMFERNYLETAIARRVLTTANRKIFHVDG